MRKLLTVVVMLMALPTWAAEDGFEARRDFGMPLETPGKVIHGVGQSQLIEFAGLATHLPADRQPAFTMVYMGLRASPEKIKQRFDGWAAWLQGMPGDAGFQLGLSFKTRGSDADQRAHAKAVADGKFDASLRQLAASIDALDRPVWVRIGYECNGFWNGYQPETYKPAFRHIAELLRKHGGEKLAIVWCVHPIDGMGRLMEFYPGDDWVDWWSIDLFQPKFMNRKVVRDFCRKAMEHGRPVLIGEATPTEVKRSEQWDRWFKPFFELIRTEPAIKGFSFINRNWNVSRWDWGEARVHRDEELLRRYKTEMASPLYRHAAEPAPGKLRLAAATLEGPTDERGRYRLTRDATRTLRLPGDSEGADLAILTLAYRLLDAEARPVGKGDGELRLEVRDAAGGVVLAAESCEARERAQQVELVLTPKLRQVEGPLELTVSGAFAGSVALHGPRTKGGMPPQLTWVMSDD